MTGCNGCGSCCDPVWMPYTQDEARHYEMDSEDKRWILKDLTPMPMLQAMLREPELIERLTDMSLRGYIEPMRFYSCRHFDSQTRECTIHDDRPPACRRFPWIGGKPVPLTPLPPTCSFRADIGEVVHPQTS